MKKLIYFPLVIAILVLCQAPVHGKEPDKKYMEEILVSQLHNEISKALRDSYQFKVLQYEDARIVAIEKEAVPEPSEGMRPGMIYKITLQVDVIKNAEQRDLCTITLSNDTTDGNFVVKQLKINSHR